MILIEIKQYFQEVGDATVSQIAKHFNLQISAAQGMIDFWLQKNKLQLCKQECTKGSCNGCALATKRYTHAPS